MFRDPSPLMPLLSEICPRSLPCYHGSTDNTMARLLVICHFFVETDLVTWRHSHKGLTSVMVVAADQQDKIINVHTAVHLCVLSTCQHCTLYLCSFSLVLVFWAHMHRIPKLLKYLEVLCIDTRRVGTCHFSYMYVQVVCKIWACTLEWKLPLHHHDFCKPHQLMVLHSTA